jgi:rod shape-determining protein MreD
MTFGLFKEIAYSKVLTFLVLYLVVIVYETLLADIFRLGPARLDLGLLLLIYVTLNQGTKPGIIFGFGLGLLLDLMTPLWLGLDSLIKSTLSYLMGLFKESLFVESIFSKLLLVFLAVLVNDFLRFCCTYSFDFTKIGPILWPTTLLSAVYTSGVAGLAMFLTKTKKPKLQTT